MTSIGTGVSIIFLSNNYDLIFNIVFSFLKSMIYQQHNFHQMVEYFKLNTQTRLLKIAGIYDM